jgi:hypothetical protein
VTIQVRQDLANAIEETVQSRQYDHEGDVSHDALIQLRPGSAAAVTADHCVEIDPLEAASSDQASRGDPAEIALENQAPYTGPEVNEADAPSIDDEEICSEVAIRERLIEWLVGFLPGDSVGNQGSP